MIVSILGHYTPTNYCLMFDAAAKCKVDLNTIEQVVDGTNFALTAHVSGTWATEPKFIETLQKMTAGNSKIVMHVDATPLDDDSDDQYTEYTISLEIPEPNSAGFRDLIRYLHKSKCIVRKVHLRSHITYITGSQSSSGFIQVGVPGDYNISQSILENIGFAADLAGMAIGLSLNLD